jgi:hypothetical protein
MCPHGQGRESISFAAGPFSMAVVVVAGAVTAAVTVASTFRGLSFSIGAAGEIS